MGEERVVAWLVGTAQGNGKAQSLHVTFHCSEKNKTLRYVSNGRAEGLDLCCVLGGRGLFNVSVATAALWLLSGRMLSAGHVLAISSSSRF